MLIKLPQEINYFELYYTMRCNFSCEYCINKHDIVKRARKEISADTLVKAINKIDFGNVPLTIGGGEFSVRKDCYQFINGLREDIKIDLLTNIQFDVEDFTQNVPLDRLYRGNSEAYKSIRVSYHPSQTINPYVLVEKVKRLQDHGFQVGIFGISHPENTDANIMMSEIARKSGVYFFIKDFLGTYDNQIFGYYKDIGAISSKAGKKCKCRIYEILIGPCGDIYKCHRDLYRQEHAVDNILNKNCKFEFVYRDCSNYGLCNPCDVKIKANRFLKMGKCSTDIIII